MCITVPLSAVFFFSRLFSDRDFAARATAPEYLILEYSVEGKSILTRILVLIVYPQFNTKMR